MLVALEMVHIYVEPLKNKVIYVYPTNDNAKTLQYKDKSNICFNINANKTDCKDLDDFNIFKKFKIQK